MNDRQCRILTFIILFGFVILISLNLNTQGKIDNLEVSKVVATKSLQDINIINATAQELGDIFPAGKIMVETNDDLKFIMMPHIGARMSRLLANGFELSELPTDIYSLNDIQFSRSIEAVFDLEFKKERNTTHRQNYCYLQPVFDKLSSVCLKIRIELHPGKTLLKNIRVQIVKNMTNPGIFIKLDDRKIKTVYPNQDSQDLCLDTKIDEKEKLFQALIFLDDGVVAQQIRVYKGKDGSHYSESEHYFKCLKSGLYEGYFIKTDGKNNVIEKHKMTEFVGWLPASLDG